MFNNRCQECDNCKYIQETWDRIMPPGAPPNMEFWNPLLAENPCTERMAQRRAYDAANDALSFDPALDDGGW